MAQAMRQQMQMSTVAASAKSAQEVADMETHQMALEIIPVWMNTVMQVTHMVPGDRARPFTIGEDPSASFKVSADQLASHERWPLVRADGTVCVPPTAEQVRLTRADGSELTGEQVGSRVSLVKGEKLRLKLGPLTFLVRAVAAARKPRLPMVVDWATMSFTGASLALNALVLSLAFFFPPDTDHIVHDTAFEQSRWGRLLAEPVDVQIEDLPDWMQKPEEEKQAEGGDGERHVGDEGQMGDTSARKSDKMYGIKGDAAPDERQLARMQRDQISKTGILSALNQSMDMPTSKFGADEAMGSDHMNALGALMGASVGPNFGYGGMGLIGSGDGGAGTGEGTIGLGHGVWTKIGHGSGGGPDGVGYCAGGKCGGGLKKKGGGKVPPKVNINGKGQVIGCLSKEAIRRVIRQHINEVKHCYEKGLMSSPDLEGRVTVKFTINQNGSVGTSKVAGSSLDDAKVGQCVAQAVQRWTFSPLEGCGVVVVSYPFNFVPASGQ